MSIFKVYLSLTLNLIFQLADKLPSQSRDRKLRHQVEKRKNEFRRYQLPGGEQQLRTR
jgi:hypothetical protein